MMIIKIKGHQHRWLAGDYDLDIFRGGLHAHGGYFVDTVACDGAMFVRAHFEGPECENDYTLPRKDTYRLLRSFKI